MAMKYLNPFYSIDELDVEGLWLIGSVVTGLASIVAALTFMLLLPDMLHYLNTGESVGTAYQYTLLVCSIVTTYLYNTIHYFIGGWK